jgi:predicted ATPase
MEGKRFIKRIKVQNLLSFDEEGIDLELQPLNVLIGPNGSGKSNLIDVFKVLQATRDDLTRPFTAEGGLAQWLHIGKRSGIPTAAIETTVATDSQEGYDHVIAFSMVGQKLSVIGERVRGRLFGTSNESQEVPGPMFYSYEGGKVTLSPSAKSGRAWSTENERMYVQRLEHEVKNQSVLSRLRDPFNFPEINDISRLYGDTAIYQQWTMGRTSEARLPQPADLTGDQLFSDGKNLGAVLNEMKRPMGLHDQLVEIMKGLYPRVTQIEVITSSGTVQAYLREKEVRELVPATRLSDGTMRFLCLLAVLLHPSPPPVVCIEEPELGLHPDMIHKVAELLKEASTRMQLIVTTHSDLLVSALSDVPEAIVVCEHDGSGTRMQRLEPEKLQGWLKEYQGNLGELWLRGHLGGTRW